MKRLGQLIVLCVTIVGGCDSQSERVGEWRDAQIREACYGDVGDAWGGRNGGPKRPENVNIDIRDYNRILEMTAALHCYVVTNANAVCDKDNRAYIVEYIGRYFSTKEDMLANAAGQGAAEAKAMQALWAAPKNVAIDQALDQDMRQGRLAKSDFGWSAPAVLQPALDQYENRLDTCPTQSNLKGKSLTVADLRTDQRLLDKTLRDCAEQYNSGSYPSTLCVNALEAAGRESDPGAVDAGPSVRDSRGMPLFHRVEPSMRQ